MCSTSPLTGNFCHAAFAKGKRCMIGTFAGVVGCVARYDASGNPAWAREFGGATQAAGESHPCAAGDAAQETGEAGELVATRLVAGVRSTSEARGGVAGHAPEGSLPRSRGKSHVPPG